MIRLWLLLYNWHLIYVHVVCECVCWNRVRLSFWGWLKLYMNWKKISSIFPLPMFIAIGLNILAKISVLSLTILYIMYWWIKCGDVEKKRERRDRRFLVGIIVVQVEILIRIDITSYRKCWIDRLVRNCSLLFQRKFYINKIDKSQIHLKSK